MRWPRRFISTSSTAVLKINGGKALLSRRFYFGRFVLVKQNKSSAWSLILVSSRAVLGGDYGIFALI